MWNQHLKLLYNCCTTRARNAPEHPLTPQNELYHTTTYAGHGRFVISRSAVQLRSSAPFLSPCASKQSSRFPNKSIGTGPDRTSVRHEFESDYSCNRSRLGSFGVDRCRRAG